MEAVSQLNTGAKYDSKVFQKSVGLNGVGTKAVNALCSYFKVQSFRSGKTRAVAFKQGDPTYRNGTLSVDVKVQCTKEMLAKRGGRLTANLYDGSTIPTATTTAALDKKEFKQSEDGLYYASIHLTLPDVENVRQWSAEHPERYDLELIIGNKKSELERLHTSVEFLPIRIMPGGCTGCLLTGYCGRLIIYAPRCLRACLLPVQSISL